MIGNCGRGHFQFHSSYNTYSYVSFVIIKEDDYISSNKDEFNNSGVRKSRNANEEYEE